MDDAGLTSKLEKPAPIAANGLGAVSLTVGDTLDRTSAMLNAGLRYWQTECLRWVDEAAADHQATFHRLLESKTPLDVLTVEHDWLRARSRSFLESGIRFIDAFAATTRGAKGDAVEGPSRRKRERGADRPAPHELRAAPRRRADRAVAARPPRTLRLARARRSRPPALGRPAAGDSRRFRISG